MNFEEIKNIYDRLEIISVKIEPRTIPNPRYISEKLGECHVCIEEVERFFIKVSRDLSVLTRALNNAEVRYQALKDELIATDPVIITLPSSKDREAHANTRLKDQLDEIRNYKNQIFDLEQLHATILMKLKTLGRANSDIKTQLRLMESQIKLGSGSIDDATTKSLMDEIKKTVLGADVWEGTESKSEETKTVDPAKPITAEILDPLSLLETKVKNLSTVDLTPINNDSKTEAESDSVNMDEDLSDPLTNYVSKLEKSFPDDDPLASVEPSKEIPETEVKSGPYNLDLDKILTPNVHTSTVTGGEFKEPKSTVEAETKVTQQVPQKNSNQMDFSALLSQFS